TPQADVLPALGRPKGSHVQHRYHHKDWQLRMDRRMWQGHRRPPRGVYLIWKESEGQRLKNVGSIHGSVRRVPSQRKGPISRFWFPYTQLARDLLVEEPCHHERHHLPLARRQRAIPAAQGFARCPLLARLAVACERLLNGVEQLLVAEELGQKLHGPGFHRLPGHRDIAVAGD